MASKNKVESIMKKNNVSRSIANSMVANDVTTISAYRKLRKLKRKGIEYHKQKIKK